MQLTGKKIAALKECLPHLKKLYTRLSCVCTPRDFEDPEQGLMFWGRVQALTIDLDYMMNHYFLNFVYDYGHNLSELTILDQVIHQIFLNILKNKVKNIFYSRFANCS